MTVTAPLATQDLAIEQRHLPVVVPGPAVDDDYSLLRDPIVPFLLLGAISFAAMIIAAFLLSAGTV